MVVITDQGSGPGDFIMTRRAYARLAQTADAAASLLALGVIDIEYKRSVSLFFLLYVEITIILILVYKIYQKKIKKMPDFSF